MLSLMSYEHVRRSVSLIIRLVSEFTGTDYQARSSSYSKKAVFALGNDFHIKCTENVIFIIK